MKARIEELKASGAIVRLPDGQTAWLPAYEMYADFKLHEDFRERGKDQVGKEIDVIEINMAFSNRQKCVSYIRVNDDPWKHVGYWNDRSVKVMEVSAIIGNWVLGIISPGINAKISLNSTKGLLPESWNHFERPLPGDEAAGWFCKDKVDNDNRFVILDFAGYVRSQVSVKDALFLLYRKL